MLKTDPAPFMSAAAAKLIETGNIEDDLASVAECDWIVEVVVERLDIKQALYRKLDAVRRPGTAISSNTSTIPLQDADRRPAAKASARLHDHAFLQSAALHAPAGGRRQGRRTNKALADKVAPFCDTRHGQERGRLQGQPGFIANRLGVFWMTGAVTEAIERGLTIEEADAIMGRPFGVPKTGVFGLIDLVGIDLMPHINASLAGALPKSDAFHAINRECR